MRLPGVMSKVISMLMFVFILITNVNISAWAENVQSNQTMEKKVELKTFLPEEIRQHLEKSKRGLGFDNLSTDRTERYIVKYKKESGKKKLREKLNNKLKESRTVKNKAFSNDSLEVITLNKKFKPSEIISQFKDLQDSDEIEYIQPDHRLRVLSDDSVAVNNQWRLQNNLSVNSTGNAGALSIDINVLPAWQITQGEGVFVAVIDSGIDITHQSLAENIWINSGEIAGNGIDDDNNGYIDDVNGWNFTNNTNTIYSAQDVGNDDHGTFVAGIIAAANNDKENVIGVASKAKILPLKAFQDREAFTSQIIESINYAEKMNAKIVNCSWGTNENNLALKETIEKSGMLFICAAGNGALNLEVDPIYPAAYKLPNVLAVASMSNNGALSAFSNYSAKIVEVAAPGENIRSTLANNTYGEMSGTSMSAAVLSGEAALVLSKFNQMNASQIKQQIVYSSDRLSILKDKVSEGNKINCANAVSSIVDNNVTRPLVEITEENGIDSISATFNNSTFVPFAVNEYNLMSTGGAGCLVVRKDSSVWIWGPEYNSVPKKIPGLDPVKEVSVGEGHYMVLTNDGQVYTWGANYLGQLGDGSNEDKDIPQNITAKFNLLPGYKIISAKAAYNYNFALAYNESDGKQQLFMWGDNRYYQLGDGSEDNYKAEPQDITSKFNFSNSEEKFVSFAGGAMHSIAVTYDGSSTRVYTWGNSYFGQWGNGTSGVDYIYNEFGEIIGAELQRGRNIPGNIGLPLALNEQAICVAAGIYNSFLVTSQGKVFAWGDDSSDQLGNGYDYLQEGYPVQINSYISGLIDQSEKIVSISGGYYHTIALTNMRRVLAWGDNSYGQLGDDSTVVQYASVPKLVNSLPADVSTITAAGNMNMALRGEGVLWSWGANSFTYDVNSISYYPVKISMPSVMTIPINNNTRIDYTLTASNVNQLNQYTYYIQYNPNNLTVVDLCETTSQPEILAGKILGADIEILEHNTETGLIRISLTESTKRGGWSGIINRIQFSVKPDSDSQTDISSIYYIDK